MGTTSRPNDFQFTFDLSHQMAPTKHQNMLNASFLFRIFQVPNVSPVNLWFYSFFSVFFFILSPRSFFSISYLNEKHTVFNDASRKIT